MYEDADLLIPNVSIQLESSHLNIRKQTLTRHHSYHHVHHGLSSPQNCKEYISVVVLACDSIVNQDNG